MSDTTTTQEELPTPSATTTAKGERKQLDPQLVSKAIRRFDWVLAYMTLNDRFNYEILGRCQRTPTEDIPTMAVGPSGIEVALHYSPTFAESLGDDELRWVLSHEVLHIAFHHITTRSPKDKTEAALDNCAADLAINSLLGLSGHNGKAPVAAEDILHPKTGAVKVRKGQPVVLTPEQFGFPEKLSMEVYRELLRDKYKDGDPDDLEADTEGQAVDSHEGWSPNTSADAQIRDWVERIDAGRLWGNLNADIVAGIKAAQRAEVAWDKELRYYLGRMESHQRRHTMKKPSRRVGYPWCGTTKNYVDNPLFAPDTSASVDDGNLGKFLCELNSLAARRPVHFMSWSCGLTMEKPMVWDRRKPALEFKGRGGTDPNPVIKYAAENGYKQLIMLTDGEFFGKVEEYPHVDILWVITCDGTTSCLPPSARVVKMTHKG
jgi:predicted metal-dependent peptidase